MNVSIQVKIAEPVKIDGKWHRLGDTPHVSPEVAQQLERDGFLAETPAELSGLAGGMPGFDEQVAATAKTLAEAMVDTVVSEAMTAHDAKLTELRAAAAEANAQRDQLQERVLDLQQQTETLKADLDAARALATNADSEVRSLQARNHELEAELAEVAASGATAEIADIQPADDAPKPSPKKGSKTKG